jgi:hypothetical protein
MKKVLRFKNYHAAGHRLACSILSVLSLVITTGMFDGRASESVDEMERTKESAVSSLKFLKKSLGEYPDHRAELIAAALQTFAADEENQHRVIYVAREVFPNETTALVEELMLLNADVVVSLRPAFLADTAVVRAALAELRADETDTVNPAAASHLPLVAIDEEVAPAESAIDMSQALATDATFALAVEESMVDPSTAVDTSFDLRASDRSPLPSPKDSSVHGPEKEVARDQIKLPEESLSADESSLNNALEFDEANERDLAKSPVRIDDAWKPSEDIYLDESKFEKRRLTAAEMATQAAPEERAELDFQSTVDHQAAGFGPPPLNMPTMTPEL